METLAFPQAGFSPAGEYEFISARLCKSVSQIEGSYTLYTLINPKQKGIGDEKPKSIVMSFLPSIQKFRGCYSNVAGCRPPSRAFPNPCIKTVYCIFIHSGPR